MKDEDIFDGDPRASASQVAKNETRFHRRGPVEFDSTLPLSRSRFSPRNRRISSLALRQD